MKKLALFVMLTLPLSAHALEATKENCIKTLSDLNLPTEPYEFKDGFFTEKHVFGDVECYKKAGNIYVKRGLVNHVMSGYFGREAVQAWLKTEKLHDEKEGELKATLDEKIKLMKKEHAQALIDLRKDTDRTLQQIKDNNIPESISRAVESEHQAAKDKAKAKADRIVEKAAAKAGKQAAKDKEEIEKKRKGWHCLSGWNGEHRKFAKTIKNALNDPGSFEHVETLTAPVKNGRHTIKMTYRAKNGFGATITSAALGSYSNSDCDDVSVISAQ